MSITSQWLPSPPWPTSASTTKTSISPHKNHQSELVVGALVVGASLKRAQAEGRILRLSFVLLFAGRRLSSRCPDPRGKPPAAEWRWHPAGPDPRGKPARAPFCEWCEGSAFRFSLGVGCPILAGLVFARVGLFRDGRRVAKRFDEFLIAENRNAKVRLGAAPLRLSRVRFLTLLFRRACLFRS